MSNNTQKINKNNFSCINAKKIINRNCAPCVNFPAPALLWKVVKKSNACVDKTRHYQESPPASNQQKIPCQKPSTRWRRVALPRATEENIQNYRFKDPIIWRRVRSLWSFLCSSFFFVVVRRVGQSAKAQKICISDLWPFLRNTHHPLSPYIFPPSTWQLHLFSIKHLRCTQLNLVLLLLLLSRRVCLDNERQHVHTKEAGHKARNRRRQTSPPNGRGLTLCLKNCRRSGGSKLSSGWHVELLQGGIWGWIFWKNIVHFSFWRFLYNRNVFKNITRRYNF